MSVRSKITSHQISSTSFWCRLRFDVHKQTKWDPLRWVHSFNTCGAFQTHMLELSLGGGAGGGVLAHTHGGVALIDLTHFPLLAVVVQAGICEIKTQKQSYSVFFSRNGSWVKHWFNRGQNRHHEATQTRILSFSSLSLKLKWNHS